MRKNVFKNIKIEKNLKFENLIFLKNILNAPYPHFNDSPDPSSSDAPEYFFKICWEGPYELPCQILSL